MSIPSCGPQRGPLGKLFARIAAGLPSLFFISVRVIPEEICLYASTENFALGSEVLFWDRTVLAPPIKIIIKVTTRANRIFFESNAMHNQRANRSEMKPKPRLSRVWVAPGVMAAVFHSYLIPIEQLNSFPQLLAPEWLK